MVGLYYLQKTMSVNKANLRVGAEQDNKNIRCHHFLYFVILIIIISLFRVKHTF